MAEIGKGYIPVTFDKAQIGKSLSAGVAGGAKASEGSIAGTFKRLAGIATAAFGAAKVFGFVSDSIDEARESNKVAAQTEAVIKSTGGAAKLTAGDFSELADSISAKTGIDDEAIQTAENLLATFTNVREEVGAGNDIFSQATQVAVDMGAALGGDAASNSILLGKALNDPIRGLTALTRVGVTFDDGQREQIKTMQEHGDILGAQKIILAELNKEFGGSAEATATAGDKFGVFVGNIQEGIGKFLIPLLDDLATWAMTTLPDAFGSFQDAMEPVVGALQTIGDVIGTVVDPVLGFFADHWDQLKPILIAVGAVLAGAILGVVISLAVPMGILVAGIAAAAAAAVLLVQGFQWLWEKSEPLRQIIGDVLSPVFAALVVAIQGVITFVQTSWPYVRDTFVTVFDAMKLAWDTVGKPIFDFITTAAQGVITFFQTIWPPVAVLFSAAFGLMQTAWDTIGKPIFDTIVSVAQTVIDWFSTAWTAASTAFGAVFSAMQTAWDTFGSPIFDTIKSIAQGVIDFFGTAWSGITGAFEAVWHVMQSAWDKFGAPLFNTIKGIIDAIVGSIKWILDHIPSLPGLSGGTSALNPLNNLEGGPRPQDKGNQRAGGGPVSAYGSYVVGEQGPEILSMGSQGGWITPNHALTGGGGPTVIVQVSVNGYLRDKQAMNELGEAVAQPVRRVLLKTSGRNPAGVIGLL